MAATTTSAGVLESMIGSWSGLAALGQAALRYVLLFAIVILLTMIAVRCVNAGFRKTIQKMIDAGNQSNASVFGFLRHLALVGVYFTSISIIVSNIPALNSGVTKLMAAGGILAVVFGVAAQQALGSMVSGLMILFFKPFVIGDIVNVISVGVAGSVEEITLNHTIIKTIENKRVIVPNSTMSSAVVENCDFQDKRVCLFLDVGITYESDAKRALDLLAQTVANHPDYLDVRTVEQKSAGVPLVTTRVVELADSCVVLRALLWGKDNGTTVVMRSDLMLRVKEQFSANDVDIAYPHLVLVNKT